MPVEDTSWVSKEAARILGAIQATPGDKLIRTLLRRNGDEGDNVPGSAVPDGYTYIAYKPSSSRLHATGGGTVAYHAHPSDISGDFAPFLIDYTQARGETFRQMIVTRGEKGSSLTEPETIALRQREEANASAIYNIDVDYLTRKDGGYFPDSKLLDHLPELTARIKDDISAKKPQRLLLPSPWPDHPDHLAVFIAGMNAATQLREEGYFQKNGKIEIIACEPEFGIKHGKSAMAKKVAESYSAQYAYKYQMDKDTGLIYPASDIASTQDASLSDIHQFPLAVSPFTITVSGKAAHKKMTALLQHETQTSGKADYLHGIPALDAVRGKAAGAAWGVGIYPIQVSGVTVEGTPFIDAAPRENHDFHIFQLKRNEIGMNASRQARIAAERNARTSSSIFPG